MSIQSDLENLAIERCSRALMGVLSICPTRAMEVSVAEMVIMKFVGVLAAARYADFDGPGRTPEEMSAFGLRVLDELRAEFAAEIARTT